MTKDESEKLAVLSEKIDALITSHSYLRSDVKDIKGDQSKDELAIAVLIEQYGTLNGRVNSWNLLNSLGIVIVAIAAGIASIFKK